MLPEKNQGDPARDQAERQSNYLILSSLEQKLPPELFRQILNEIQGSMNMPSRLSWTGKKSESAYADLKMAQGHLNTGFLTTLMQAVGEFQKKSGSKDSQISQAKNLQTLLKQTSQRQQYQRTNLFAKVHRKPGQLTAQMRREVELSQFMDFKRMKTVFCHADHTTDEVSSIFNVQFDRTGRFIISGADDGILKVWDRDTLTLQASLHGHLDFITDIDVSKCNRFIASAGKDAQVIIWDLKMGRIVKRLTSHQSLINRLLFVAPRVPSNSTAATSQQAEMNQVGSHSTVGAFMAAQSLDAENDQRDLSGVPTSSYVKDQFLLTCSDDGTVHLYDFSPLSRVVTNPGTSSQRNSSSQNHMSGGNQQNRADYDEMRIRRSGRRSAVTNNNNNAANADANGNENNDDNEENNEVFIFDVALTPDDYRPGTRNKKLDAVACSSAGIVVAGTSTGEIFCWKLNFTEIARRNKAESFRYLGQFKICKNAGVQFAEFSPTSDHLLTGSTDGSVKIWRLDIPSSKAMQQSTLKAFSLADDSRLIVTIDEKNGCIKTNSISYFDEEGLENFEYVPVKQPVSGQIGFGKIVKDVKFSKSQCDAIKWSVRGRFAIASITSQIEDSRNDGVVRPDEFKEEVCRIKIWDTVNETFYDDLARPCGHQLRKNSWVLAPHPIFEELLMTGSDGGTLILWNLECKQIIQDFSQYGVYSIDGYVRDNPLDGKFSCDGRAFIVGNQLGTISLFSCDPVEHQYESTRVQQFFMYDRSRNSQNPFERIENRPQICGYNMIPHEAQPARPLIGRFNSDSIRSHQANNQIAGIQSNSIVPIGNPRNQSYNADGIEESKNAELQPKQLSKEELLSVKQTWSKTFERKLITAKELGHLEEKYYQHQLTNCLQDSYQPNVLEQGNQLDAFVESSIEVLNNAGWANERDRVESGYEDQSLVNALSQSRRVGVNNRNQIAGDFQSPASQNVRSRAQVSGQRRAIGVNGSNNNNNNQPQQQEGRAGGRRLVRRSDRTLRDMPEINGYDSHNERDQLMVDQLDRSPQSAFVNYSEEDSASDASDLESSPEVVRQRFEVRRANVHERFIQNQEEVEEEQRNRRADRLARRNEIRDPSEQMEESRPRRRTGGRERNRSEVENGDTASVNIDLDDETPLRRRGRGRPSNAERERMRAQQERSHQHIPENGGGSSSTRRRVIYDESASQDITMNEDNPHNNQRSTRTRLRQANNRGDTMNSGTRSRGGASSTPEQQNRNSGSQNQRRNARRIVESSSNTRMDDVEERKGSPSKAEKTHNQIIRESGYFLSDREEASAYNFDRKVQGNEEYDDSDSSDNHRDAVFMSEPDPPGTQLNQQDYELVEKATLVKLIGTSALQIPKICSFCRKNDDPLVGPFCKFESIEQTKIVGQPLYFHQDCIEMNLYSKFCVESKKWVNISKALQNLVHEEQFSCFRCQTKGATVQCKDCQKAFHGFKCARMYTLQLGDDENNQVFYQCIFCRNSQNWEDRVSELVDKETERQELEREGLLHQKPYLRQLKAIDKQHLLAAQGYQQQLNDQNSLASSYNPQVNDFVFYFFQGHEYYLTQYSCHYFCGQLQNFPRHRFMPWIKHPKIKKREFVRCRVESVDILFPSQRSLNLISLYGGTCTQVTQTAQIIQRISLVVIESNQQNFQSSNSSNSSNQIRFQVDIFPNQLPDFLIPQAIFTEKYERYVKALQTGIVDKTFKVFLKDQNIVKQMRIVVGNSPLEPTSYPNSLWQNIKCVDANPGRSGHGRVTEMPQHRSTRQRQQNTTEAQELDEDECERVSFWDIQFGGTEEIQAIQKAMTVFGKDEKAKLVNTLKDFMEKKKEYIECFVDRVPVEVAPDYRSIIPAEMYFNLIKERINNCYYRSQEQLLSDIDLISYNAVIYNGANHDISVNAKELCEIIRVKLKQAMFTKSETLMQQQMAQAGKLTVPSRTRTALQQKTIMDEMRNSLHDEPANPAIDQLMIDLPVVQTMAAAGNNSSLSQVAQQQHIMSNNNIINTNSSQANPAQVSTKLQMTQAIAANLEANHQDQQQQSSKVRVDEESKTSGQRKNQSSAQAQPPSSTSNNIASNEEKKESDSNAAAQTTNLITINLGLTTAAADQDTLDDKEKDASTQQMLQEQPVPPIPSSQQIAAPVASLMQKTTRKTVNNQQQQQQQQATQLTNNNQSSTNMMAMTMQQQQYQSQQNQKQSSKDTSNAAGQARPSNNMNRRRNRINANLIGAEELEEKTKTDAANSAIEAASIIVTENEEQQMAAANKRVTRKSKRKRTE